MRLIDADKSEKEMNEVCGGECEVCGLSDCPVYSQPTAYDTDNIVEKIEAIEAFNGCCDCGYREKCKELRKIYKVPDNVNSCALTVKRIAIEIVKAGGVNG